MQPTLLPVWRAERDTVGRTRARRAHAQARARAGARDHAPTDGVRASEHGPEHTRGGAPLLPPQSGYRNVIPNTVTITSTTGTSTTNTRNVYPITSRARSPNSPRMGSIQNGCTRLASASPRS